VPRALIPARSGKCARNFVVPDVALILHYFGLVHSRRALREMEPQISRSCSREALDFVGKIQEWREFGGFLHANATRIRRTRRKQKIPGLGLRRPGFVHDRRTEPAVRHGLRVLTLQLLETYWLGVVLRNLAYA